MAVNTGLRNCATCDFTVNLSAYLLNMLTVIITIIFVADIINKLYKHVRCALSVASITVVFSFYCISALDYQTTFSGSVERTTG